VLLTLTLAGCAIGTKTDATRVEPDPVGACTVWRIITWADGDTDETLKQIKANNAARRAYCRDITERPPPRASGWQQTGALGRQPAQV
jgi:hypothetical protein